MDENSELFENFEGILRKRSARKHVALYNGHRHPVSKDSGSKNSFTVRETLLNVSKQIKAIQDADCIEVTKRVPKNINLYKKSDFVPINMLPRHLEAPAQCNTNNFDTQCVSGTQLINIIQDAEALDASMGITQEFDSVFSNTYIEGRNYGIDNDTKTKNNFISFKSEKGNDAHHLNEIVIENQEVETQNHYEDFDTQAGYFPIIDISLKEPDPNLKIFNLSIKDNEVNNFINNDEDNLIGKVFEGNNDCVENDDLTVDDLDMPSSPVFVIKPSIKKTASPLVFDLILFENFERMATPLVEKNLDFETIRFLINSQIIGKELIINADTEPMIQQIGEQISPIHKMDSNQLNLDDSMEIFTPEYQDTEHRDECIVNKELNKSKFILEDEILFSSDEDEAYIHKEIQDLPLTCALESSFSTTSEVLDKSMFVGFQTASNKSIQICTDSFCKAKTIFDDMGLGIRKPTLSELVKSFDDLNRNKNICDLNSIMQLNPEETDIVEVNDMTADGKTTIVEVLLKSQSVVENIVNECPKSDSSGIGFRTASNKIIRLSDIALAKSKHIFQDILCEVNDLKKVELENCGSQFSKSEALTEYVDSNESCAESAIDEAVLDEFVNNGMSEDIKDNILNNQTIGLGFRTASNKNIEISDDALAKTKKIFDDINLIETDTNIDKNEQKATVIGFKKLTSKHVVQDIDNIVDVKETHEMRPEAKNILSPKICEKPSTSKVFTGFKTANNKVIHISDEALSKTKNIFQDIETTESFKDSPVRKDTLNVSFRAESGKKVQKSATAVTNSKKIFQDTDSETNNNFGDFETKIETLPKSITGFKTASHKISKLSEGGLIKSETMFKDPQFTDKFNNLVPKYILNNTDKEMQGFNGFQTASNKPVKISAQALAKSRVIFQGIDEEIPEVTHDVNDYLVTKNITSNTGKEIPGGLIGFQTASKKPVRISAQALAKSKVIFQGIDEQIPEVTCDENDYLVTKDMTSNTEKEIPGGFQTASKKTVRISAQALARSKAIFQGIDEEIPGLVSSGSNNLDPKRISNNTEKEIPEGFTDFLTAIKNRVKISTEALDRSKAIFQGIDEEIPGVLNAGYINLALKDISNTDKETPGFNGFQTASKKPVRISAQALANSKAIFQGIDEKTPEITNDGNDNIPSQIISFPAGVKEVNISNKGKKIFQDVTEKVSSTCNTDDNNMETAPIFRGFQTANNKAIKISEIALAKSKNIFDEIYQQERKEIVQKTSSFGGFQTANNEQVLTSEKALAKSKRVFQDLDFEDVNSLQRDFKKTKLNTDLDNDNLDTTTKLPIFGFQTGNNNRIEVSEEALRMSRKLLGDADDTGRIPKKECNQQICGKVLNNNDINVNSIINTQVLNNFDESLHTEDFYKEKTPVKTSKRSGSPILSCPKAKKRKKFAIPYSQSIVKEYDNIKNNNQKLKKPQNVYKYDANYKKTKKYNLKDLVTLEKESVDLEMNLDPYVTKFNFDNLQDFEFSTERNDITNVIWTITNLKQYFLDSVNQNLVPDGWVDNHILLILRKLIFYEIRFPKTMAKVCTTKNVMEQLKYRYDKELYNAERPCLRKILEKDDVSTRTMVLCVIAVFEDGVTITSLPKTTNNIELLVTDGWYCLRATMDQMLTQLVLEGKIAVGTKIVTSGADLVNCEQGVAPWEDISSIRLKLHGNSTRRARLHARLGRHGNAPATPLRCVQASGGRVARLRVLVTRVYPALYVEKFADGSTVTRSERMERLHETRHESERQAVLEKLYEEVEKELADQLDSTDSDEPSDCKGLETGSQIARGMKTSRDPAEFRSHLSESQKTLLLDHTSKQREALLQNIERRVVEKIEKGGLNVNRNVVVLLKIRVVGVDEGGGTVEGTRAMMSIWRPNDAVQEILKEGSWIEVTDVVPTAVRYSEIQLSAGRQSIFNQSKQTQSEKIKAYESALKRTCYTIKDLAKNPAMTTDYNEIDTVGLIFSIEPSNKEFDTNKHQFQNVFLCDIDKNIISVNFWGGLKKFGFENVFDTGQIVSCTNLQKRAGNTRKSIPQYRVTEFSYFTKVPKNKSARDLAEGLSKKLSCVNVARFCGDCATLKNNYSAIKLHRYTESISPYRFQSVDANLSKNKIFIDSPLTRKKVDDNLNLTGLDFESTFKQDTQELSPKTMLRKRQVREKIEKLKMYGEPPPLSPIQILNRSKNAGNAFKSPLVPKYETIVASEEKILLTELENAAIQRSPILNRTYVKRTVNPVKLNFSSSVAMEESDISDVVDHFAEDFDGSPPLSLD